MPKRLARRSLLSNVPWDRDSIPQDRLNIEDKVRSNLFPWNGPLTPPLTRATIVLLGGRYPAPPVKIIRGYAAALGRRSTLGREEKACVVP
jgi:hypothetical protein